MCVYFFYSDEGHPWLTDYEQAKAFKVSVGLVYSIYDLFMNSIIVVIHLNNCVYTYMADNITTSNNTIKWSGHYFKIKVKVCKADIFLM